MWFILLIFMQLFITQAYGMDEKKVKEEQKAVEEYTRFHYISQNSSLPIKEKQNNVTWNSSGQDGNNIHEQDNKKRLTNKLFMLIEQSAELQKEIIRVWINRIVQHKTWKNRKKIGCDAIKQANLHPDDLKYNTINFLIDALRSQDDDIVTWLLDNRANPNGYDQDGIPVMCYVKNIPSARTLLGHGGNINVCSKKTQQNALFYLSVGIGDVHGLISFLIANKINTQHRNIHDLTALTYFSLKPDKRDDSRGNKQIIKNLIAFNIPYAKCIDNNVRNIFKQHYGNAYETLEVYTERRINKKKNKKEQSS